MKRRKVIKSNDEESPVSGKENKPTTPKKSKVEAGAGDPGEGTSGSSPLSPEQRERMDHSKIQAQMKLTEKSTNSLVQNMGETWFTALQKEFTKPYFIKLSKFVETERKKNTIYPPPHQVFSFTNMSDFEKLKVVILGQDPYHGPNQAHGLCFSVQRGVPPPPSLENMYKELKTDISGFKHPGHGYLGGWAEQGVLLLNAVLTVKAHNANSHKGQGWEVFTDAIVSHINQHLEGVVFILWGGYAQKKGKCINEKRHHIIKGTHPSPLSAHRGFMGCKHFSKCNDLLEQTGKTPIDWTHLPLPDQ